MADDEREEWERQFALERAQRRGDDERAQWEANRTHIIGSYACGPYDTLAPLPALWPLGDAVAAAALCAERAQWERQVANLAAKVALWEQAEEAADAIELERIAAYCEEQGSPRGIADGSVLAQVMVLVGALRDAGKMLYDSLLIGGDRQARAVALASWAEVASDD